MDFYTLLGVPRDADEEAIRAAYKFLARRYHPDRGTGSSAETFRLITQAYNTLMNIGKRHAYDMALPPRRVSSVWQQPPLPQQLRREDPAVFGRYYHRSSPFGTSFVLTYVGFPGPDAASPVSGHSVAPTAPLHP
jgi:curved DNA-binding protein CbpA